MNEKIMTKCNREVVPFQSHQIPYPKCYDNCTKSDKNIMEIIMHETGSNILSLEEGNIWCNFTHRNIFPLFFLSYLVQKCGYMNYYSMHTYRNVIIYLVGTTGCILKFYIWLLFNPVKVFMQTIQKKCQQFLWIMLLVSQKLWGKSAHLKLPKYIHIWNNIKQSFILSVTIASMLKLCTYKH